MPRIVALSDLHGNLPTVPSCDILLIAGDICPATNHDIDFQERWLDTTFARWLRSLDAGQIIAIAGNHDFILEIQPWRDNRLPWLYLEDSGATVAGLRIYGSPWQPIFGDWAFNLDDEGRKQKWAMIPDDTDILVLHGPPYGYGDLTLRGEHVGCPYLRDRITGLPNLKLAVFGHIHNGRGVYNVDGKTLANVTVLNEAYQMVYGPMEFDL